MIPSCPSGSSKTHTHTRHGGIGHLSILSRTTARRPGEDQAFASLAIELSNPQPDDDDEDLDAEGDEEDADEIEEEDHGHGDEPEVVVPDAVLPARREPPEAE